MRDASGESSSLKIPSKHTTCEDDSTDTSALPNTVALQVVRKQCVNDHKGSQGHDCVDDVSKQPLNQTTAGDPGECDPGGDAIKQSDEQSSKYWEVESSETLVQITDVQGRLKQKLSYWRETLQAPPWVINCIEKG